MNRLALPAILATALSMISGPASSGAPAAIARAALVRADIAPAGTATIRLRRGKPVLELDLSGIPQGVHAVHIHAVGRCEGPGGAFSSAGPHLNPAGLKHGARNPSGHHMGDLPNVTAGRRGRIKTRIALDLDPARLRAALFDADGASLVVHAGPDDYATDPSGNSGARIACGVLTMG
jgi:superoxide dismutase, Cu-Zn family